jgi:hypothetical protein
MSREDHFDADPRRHLRQMIAQHSQSHATPPTSRAAPTGDGSGGGGGGGGGAAAVKCVLEYVLTFDAYLPTVGPALYDFRFQQVLLLDCAPLSGQ